MSIDTETNGEDVRDGRGHLTGISLAWKDTDGLNGIYLPFQHYIGNNYEFGAFRQDIQTILDTKVVVYQNAKFDLVSLTTIGPDTSRNEFMCTLLQSHLIDENKPRARDLNNLGLYYLKEPGKSKGKLQELVEKNLGWGWIPSEVIAPYAVTDAVSTLRIWYELKPHLQEQRLGKVWQHKQKFVRVINSMEKHGVKVDVDFAKSEIDRGQGIMYDIVNDLHLTPSKRSDLEKLLLVELKLPPIHKVRKNGTKTITFDKDAMKVYDQLLERINNPTAQKILEYRGWQKTISSNYAAYLDLLSPDGRLRCNYKLHGTVTGRMSCEQPNLQQIPREGTKDWNGSLKRVFIPEDGYSLIGVDYSQLELRLGTAYAKEPHLMEVFREGRDIFTEMASRLGMSRQDTKTLVYSIQYGAGVNRVSSAFGISREEARSRIETYYEAYPNFRAASQAIASRARRTGVVPLWSGRYRHLEHPENEYYKAFNSMIQGGGADVVERAMVRLDEEGFNTDSCRMLLQVHDEVVFEIRNDLVEEVVPQIKYIMSDVDTLVGEETGVKFAVDNKHWGV